MKGITPVDQLLMSCAGSDADKLHMCVLHYLQCREFVSQAEAVVYAFFMIIIDALVLLFFFPSLVFVSIVTWTRTLLDLNLNTKQVICQCLEENSQITHRFLSPLINLHSPFYVSTQHTQGGFGLYCKMLHFKMFHPWLPFAIVSTCIVFSVIN